MTEHVIQLAPRVQIDLANPELAKTLREMADDADAGKIEGVACLVEYHDGEPEFMLCGIEDPYRTAGLLVEMQQAVLADAED